jgi:hypothetical protein
MTGHDNDDEDLIISQKTREEEKKSWSSEDFFFYKLFVYVNYFCGFLFISVFLAYLLTIIFYPIETQAPLTYTKTHYIATNSNGNEYVIQLKQLGHFPMDAFLAIPTIGALYFLLMIVVRKPRSDKYDVVDDADSGEKNQQQQLRKTAQLEEDGPHWILESDALFVVYNYQVRNRGSGWKFLTFGLMFMFYTMMLGILVHISDVIMLVLMDVMVIGGLALLWYYELFIQTGEITAVTSTDLNGNSFISLSPNDIVRNSPWRKYGVMICAFTLEILPIAINITYFATLPEQSTVVIFVFIFYCLYILFAMFAYFVALGIGFGFNGETRSTSYEMTEIWMLLIQTIFICGGVLTVFVGMRNVDNMYVVDTA